MDNVLENLSKKEDRLSSLAITIRFGCSNNITPADGIKGPSISQRVEDRVL